MGALQNVIKGRVPTRNSAQPIPVLYITGEKQTAYANTNPHHLLHSDSGQGPPFGSHAQTLVMFNGGKKKSGSCS